MARFLSWSCGFSVLEGEFVVLEGEFAVLEGGFPVLECRFPVLAAEFAVLEGGFPVWRRRRTDAARARGCPVCAAHEDTQAPRTRGDGGG